MFLGRTLLSSKISWESNFNGYFRKLPKPYPSSRNDFESESSRQKTAFNQFLNFLFTAQMSAVWRARKLENNKNQQLL